MNGERGGAVAFVAGATGYTGVEVVRALRARGVTTIAHVRPDSPRLEAWRRRFCELGAATDATPWDGAAMAAMLERLAPTHVFCLIGTTRERGRRAARAGGAAETYESVDHGLTRLLAEATARAAPGARFLYLSSIGAGPRARGAYLQARWKAETAVRSSGLDHIIVRPALITGADRPEPRAGERAAAALIAPLLGVAAALGARRLQARYRPRTAGQLADALVRLALEPGGGGRVVESEELG